MPIYGKTFLLQNQESSEAESWYIASRDAGSTSVCSNGGPPVYYMATFWS